MAQVWSDVRFAFRGMAKRPALSLLVVGTLAVGLAANAAIFSSLDALLLRPLAFPNLPRLVRLWETSPGAEAYDRGNVAPGNFHDWRAQSSGVLGELVALEWWDANLRGQEVPERVSGFRVSPRFFETLGVATLAGRGFLDEEGREGASHRVVLGHDLWQRSFGGDAGIVGRSVMVDGEPHEVVGIAPLGFRFPEGAELWSPIVLPPAGTARRDQHYLSAIAVLAEGRSLEDASKAMALVAQRLQKDHPDTNASRGLMVGALQRSYEDVGLRPLFMLWQVAAGLVLLIACVNVANLMLARGAERQREMALRLALGAGRGQIVRQLLTEGLVTSVLAVGASLPLSAWAAREMRQRMPAEIARFLPGWDGIGMDGRVLGFSIALGLAATLLFTLVPALRASRSVLTDALKEGGRSATVGASRQRGRSLLVVTQVAGALALVVVAGLAVKSARALLLGPQGYDPDRLLTLQVTLPESRYREPAARRAFARNAEERLAAIPGVTGVGFANVMPGRNNNSSRAIQIEGEPAFDRSDPPLVDDRTVSPGYFEALGLPLRRGPRAPGLRRGGDPARGRGQPLAGRALLARTRSPRPTLPHRRRGRPVGHGGGRVGKPHPPVVHPAQLPDLLPPLPARPTERPGHSTPHLRRSRSPRSVGAAGGERGRRRPARLQRVEPAPGDRPVHHRPPVRGRDHGGVRRPGPGPRDQRGLRGHVLPGEPAHARDRGPRRPRGLGRRRAAAHHGSGHAPHHPGLLAGGALGLAAARALSAALMGTIPFDATTFAAATGFLATSALLAAYLPARRALAIDPAQALRAE